MTITHIFILLTTLFSPLSYQELPAADQGLPPGIIATAGELQIGESEFHTYLVRLHRGQETGKALLEQIVRETAIRQEASRRGVSVSTRILDERIGELDRALKAQTNGKKGLVTYLQDEGIDQQTFFEALRLSILHEKMARADFKLSSQEAVPAAKQNLWLKELLSKKKVVITGLEGSDVAIVDGERIGAEDFGRRLVAHLGRDEACGILREMIGIRLIEARGRELGLELTESDVEQEVTQREVMLQTKAGFEGISYADFLKASTGKDLAELQRSRKFRAEVLMKKIAKSQHTYEELVRFFESNRAFFEERYGEAARVATIFLKAVRFPNQHVSRTFEDAKEELEAIARRVAQGEAVFENMARIYSEHEAASRGGDLGFLTAASASAAKGLKEIARAAIQAEPGAILGPFETNEGCHLIQVLEKRGSIAFDAIRDEVEREARQQLYRTMLAEANIRYGL